MPPSHDNAPERGFDHPVGTGFSQAFRYTDLAVTSVIDELQPHPNARADCGRCWFLRVGFGGLLAFHPRRRHRHRWSCWIACAPTTPAFARPSSPGCGRWNRSARRFTCRAPTSAISCSRPSRGAAEARTHLVDQQHETRTALARYASPLNPEEQDSFQALRSEIDAWWQVLQTPFEWTPRERESCATRFFYEQLVPRRTTMLQIADRIATINERGLNGAEDRLAASAENLRWSLLVTFGIALLGGTSACRRDDRSDAAAGERSRDRLTETSEARADLHDSRPGSCARRKTNGARWRASCTTKWASRFRRS